MFMSPRIMRNAAEALVPRIPPILLREENRELMADAVAATTIDVIKTILAYPDRSEKS